jgi:hypothetical protein
MTATDLDNWLSPELTAGVVILEKQAALIPGAVTYACDRVGEGLVYDVTPGVFTSTSWLTLDALNPSGSDLVFVLRLFESSDDGRERPCVCRFTLLPQVQARFRFPLAATDQGRWLLPREGALLKPTLSGARVDPAAVDRVTATVLYKRTGTVTWAMTPMRSSPAEPAALERPLVLDPPVLDAVGQATYRSWPGRTAGPDDVVRRLREQHGAPDQPLAGRSRWGGWATRTVEATGFFRTYHDGRRWWLVDPDGHLFWSAGLCNVKPTVESWTEGLPGVPAWLPASEQDFAGYADCVNNPDRPQSFDYLRANLIRAFGPRRWRAAWAELAHPLLRGLGFTTAGAWSDEAAAARAGLPYVRWMSPAPAADQAPRVFRDLPDVFSPAFEHEAAVFAAQLRATRDDPALVGYFLMNEPQWAFAAMPPAEGMLAATQACATRAELARWLVERYGADGITARWGSRVTPDDIASGPWTTSLTDAARADLAAFSTVAVRRLYDILSAACRDEDPHHLNLGARFASVPQPWIVDAMGTFDVFSMNSYQLRPDPRLGDISAGLGVPALVGEWHVGAVDAGLPAPGIGHVADQAARAQGYRFYLESAAAAPWCVGAHWFTLYDQSALGRYDGENYNIGFVDVAHRPYPALAAAARASHTVMYDVADGTRAHFADPPEEMERLNM